MTKVKLTSERGEVLYGIKDEDGDYFIKELDNYILGVDLEDNNYPGWRVEEIIELPTHDWALIVPSADDAREIGYVPYLLYPGVGWTCGTNDSGEVEPAPDSEVLDFLTQEGWSVAFKGVEA